MTDTDEQRRNRRLAQNLAAGTAVPGLDEVMEGARRMAGAYLDVPGPRAVQLCDEIDRLRVGMAAARDALRVGQRVEYGLIQRLSAAEAEVEALRAPS
jgi:hypothetical protein